MRPRRRRVCAECRVGYGTDARGLTSDPTPASSEARSTRSRRSRPPWPTSTRMPGIDAPCSGSWSKTPTTQVRSGSGSWSWSAAGLMREIVFSAAPRFSWLHLVDTQPIPGWHQAGGRQVVGHLQHRDAWRLGEVDDWKPGFVPSRSIPVTGSQSAKILQVADMADAV